jgi:transposase
MEKVIKQSVGIDCAQEELVAAFGIMCQDYGIRIISHKAFPNHAEGFEDLLRWSEKLRQKEIDVNFVVESTGVYHEEVALFLHKQKQFISVVLPNKIKHFGGTENIKNVTDRIASRIIAKFGLEKKLDRWTPPAKVFNELKQLTREREQLNVELTIVRNQLHAEKAGAWPNKGSIKRMNSRITLLKKQQEQIVKEIKSILDKNPELKDRIANVCTIKGIGLLTAVIVVAETNGFNLIRNKKQLVSYAGLDVEHKTSGTSVNTKPRISKKGNKYLRKAFYMPALTAIRHDERAKGIFARLVSRHGIKMKAAVAIHRKLLELVYTLWKKNEPFDPEFSQKKLEQPIEAALNEMA